MFPAKKPGITNAIREKLGFADEGLWRKFSARRLELIDALDLSSRRASDQEENIKNVASMLMAEFGYGPDTVEDFEALVRAAVQSVRRNRKRGSKTGRANKKAKSESAIEASGKSQFLSEIAHIADTHDAIYDMSYPTKMEVSKQDRSRAAIDTIIRPCEGPLDMPVAGRERGGSLGEKTAGRAKLLQGIQQTLLLLIKRSKSCLSVTVSAKNDVFREIGQSALSSVCVLMLERSFGGINKTSFGHIREKVGSTLFQAKFYRSLEPASTASQSLDDETAVATLHTLLGCCIQDFGYDVILQHMGDAFYHCILLEYPFVASASMPFRRNPEEQEASAASGSGSASASASASFSASEITQAVKTEIPGHLLDYGSLDKLATIASKLGPDYTPSPSAEPPTSEPQVKVTLRFLSSALNFTFPTATSAPPRFNEILDNGRQAFRLTATQNYGLRNHASGAAITDDAGLERLFAAHRQVDLEIHAIRGSSLPLRDMAPRPAPAIPRPDSPRLFTPGSFSRPSSSESRIILPPPTAQVVKSMDMPKFQPLL